MGDAGLRVQTSSWKVNPGDLTYSVGTIMGNTAAYLEDSRS